MKNRLLLISALTILYSCEKSYHCECFYQNNKITGLSSEFSRKTAKEKKQTCQTPKEINGQTVSCVWIEE